MTTPTVDLLDPAQYSDGIPHAVLAELREATPVLWVDEPATATFDGGPGFWAVLRHADVSHVSRHPEDFSSWRGTSFLRDPRPSDVKVLRRMMLNMDPPEHSSLRKIVNRAFTPQAIRRQLAASIERHAREVVDAVCEQGDIDFLAKVAAEMPLLVLADVLGVPREDRKLLYSWTNRLVGPDDPEYGADPQSFVSAFTEMFAYARATTAERRRAPGDDLWSVVANAEVDGERLSDGDLDRFFQLLVIAGNDTTRNLIANTLLTLSEHPEQLRLLREDLSLLPGAIEEVLRFSPSVIQFRRTATRDLELGGQRIAEDDKVVINYASANRDPSVFTDPDRFDITRDPNPHISFGDGTHFCLGANLARLQTRVLLTELLTRLPDIAASGAPTRLRSSFMNGIKHLPARFTPAPMAPTLTAPTAAPTATAPVAPTSTAPQHDTPFLVLYGSNFGTAEEVAEQIAEEAGRRGFATRTAPLDDHIEDLPTSGVVMIATATYNGTPPDNAVRFARWLTDSSPDLSGVAYTVFGCGNREWAATFQDFPRFVDERLAALGATRLHDRGEGDAADDFDGQLEAWDTNLWPAVGAALGLDLGGATESSRTRLRVEFVPADLPSNFAAALDARSMRVIATRDLTEPNGTVAGHRVRHIELALPDGVTYEAGDHLGVLPRNKPGLVERVAHRFGLDANAFIRLQVDDGVPSFLPLGERITVRQLLTDHVELQDVAGRRDIATLLEHTEYPWTRDALAALVEDNTYRDEVLTKRRSVLDLLEEHPTCRLPFSSFLQLLGPLTPRFYSISSSPLADARSCSITVGGLAGPARSGNGDFTGVCSNYLVGRAVDQEVHAFVRDTSTTFRLPADATRPIVLVGAGTGVAPFRGFLAERAARRAAGSPTGPGVLVFGCRHPQTDLLYGDELRELADAAGVQLACAFSRVAGLPRVYVQDRLRQLDHTVWPLLQDGGSLYICGSTSMAAGVRAALLDMHHQHAHRDGSSDAGSDSAAEAWLGTLVAEHRYLVDVWASG